MTRSRQEQAELFTSLHHNDSVLALPNAWDVMSARLVELEGAAAIATTSAGVAWSLGAADGDQLDRDRAIDLVARVVAAVSAPVTADIESGFGATPADVAETIRGIAEAGAVGVNLEDAHHGGDSPLRPIVDQAERIAAAREADPVLYINARVDVYLRGVGEPSSRVAATVERARAYLDAGASGIFVPGVVDPETISLLAKEISAPLNVLVGPGAPSIAELGELGVARASLGSGLSQAAYAVVQRGAREMLTSGTYTATADALDFGTLNSAL
ncbi:isocitrate lyase/PEP mutase family protein [Allokutzneria albata]|uniref:2-Methylisocitrate lyase, PEP mutase family n=1 Tax=Allokutzneria albata TaxID=211114 RepID=A0A1G9UYL3_ALLAB|nr:isocitrate lyase/phosphoenolpyruvate mutase family protein [Allokutzneria albata]SDM65008.1 2-Methylisocitrate lyase, PEP mutase family [Allokutzneria albata]